MGWFLSVVMVSILCSSCPRGSGFAPAMAPSATSSGSRTSMSVKFCFDSCMRLSSAGAISLISRLASSTSCLYSGNGIGLLSRKQDFRTTMRVCARGAGWLLALGSWLLALGSWLLALGSWLLAISSWLLAFCYWLFALGIWLLCHAMLSWSKLSIRRRELIALQFSDSYCSAFWLHG